MNKLFLWVFSVILLTLFSCSGEEKADDAAVRAAKEYYDSLLVGNEAYFVDGMYLPDTIPDSYREQLEANALMFVERMGEEHGGVSGVKIMRCQNDTLVSADGKSHVRTAQAFLIFAFGDSLNEEVLVPMIHHNGRWLMR